MCLSAEYFQAAPALPRTTEGFLPLVKNLCWQDEAKTKQLGPMIYSTCFNGEDVWASQMEVTVVDLDPRLPA